MNSQRNQKLATTKFGGSQPLRKKLQNIQRPFKRKKELKLKRQLIKNAVNKLGERKKKGPLLKKGLKQKRRQRPLKKEKKNSSRKKKTQPQQTLAEETVGTQRIQKAKRTRHLKRQIFEIIN